MDYFSGVAVAKFFRVHLNLPSAELMLIRKGVINV
jgi:hypothetical protein